MIVITILLVIALIGLFVTIGFIIAGALNFVKDGKRLGHMLQPTRDHAVELINTGKGIGVKGQIRYAGYSKHGKRIYSSVRTTAEEVTAAAKSVDIEGARQSLQQGAKSLSSAQEILKVAKILAELLREKDDE
jgi:hypothetical protein